ncbi:MAG: glucose ABC transporter substrate-binding protein GlcS [Thermoprotei archaeon]
MRDEDSVNNSSNYGYKRRRNNGISRELLAIVIVIVVIAGAGGGYYYYVSTKKTVQSVELYTWWATTGKIAGEHLFPVFQQKYPYYRVTTMLTPGAGGTNAKFAILTLIESGKPPSVFQSNGGPILISYSEGDPQGIQGFVNFTPIVANMGLLDPSVAVPAVMEALSYGNTMLGVPVDVHRMDLYFNPQTLKKYDLPIPTTVAQLLYDSKVLYQHGIYWAIPGGDGGWDQMNVWESFLLAYGGPRMLDEMDYGVLSVNNAYAVNATNSFLEVDQYDYPGAQAMSWTEILPDLVSGTTSFQVNGNWLTNYAYDFMNTTVYPAEAPYTSWSNVTLMEEPFPGTANYYSLVIDSIAVPTGSTQKAGLTLSEFWSSYQGQQVWTKWKAVTFYENATDWYNTPAQWADYKALLSTPEQDFVEWGGNGLFADAQSTYYTALTTLSETGSVTAFNALMSQAFSQQYADWHAASTVLHLSYLGLPGHPFGNYYPPWANTSS